MATAGTTWRAAGSIITLRNQLNTAYPNRSKISDGIIGDQAHAETVSDHNPNEAGVVCAFDITHDPANGLDIAQLAQALADSRDARIKYLIRNSEIMVPTDYGWIWVPYHGIDPHTSHLHLSVWGDYDNTTNWTIGEDRMLDEEGAKEVYRLGLHREPENDQVWRPLVGKKFSEASKSFKSSNEWLTQNHILKVAYVQAMNDANTRAARIAELEKQLAAKTTMTAAAVPQLEIIKSTPAPDSNTPANEPIDTKNVNWLVRILINLFGKK